MREFSCLADWVDCSPIHEDNCVIFMFWFLTRRLEEKHVQFTECKSALQNTVDILLSFTSVGRISIYSCNENQLDAPFILSLFRQSTSTCFGHICSPSSGGLLYIYNWHVLSLSVDCLLAVYQLYIYSKPPDDGLQICPKHIEVDWRNKLRINSASSWFSLREYSSVHITLYFVHINAQKCDRLLICKYSQQYMWLYTGCPRRKGQYSGRS
jgi:hypothetical protein